MGVENTTLKDDATAIAVTAGTDLSFTPDGVDIKNGIHLAAADVADYRVRPSITLKTRNPPLSQGKYGKSKRWLTLTQPIILADETVAFNVVRIEVEIHAETSAAEALNVARLGAQLLSDNDLVGFVATGSLA